MKEKNAMEIQSEIAKIVEDACNKGLVTKALDPELDEELQEEFKEIIKKRLEIEIRQSEIAAGITRDSTHLGASDFIKEYKEKILLAICDGKGGIKKEFRNVLGPFPSQKSRVVLNAAVEAVLPILFPSLSVPLIALYLVLYLLREGLGKLCTTCSEE